MTRRSAIAPIEHAPGTRIGLVTVLGPAPSRGRGRVYRVECECRWVREAHGWKLRQHPPKTHRSCGGDKGGL